MMKTFTPSTVEATEISGPLVLQPARNVVTFRSFLLGLIFCSLVAVLNCWLATVYQAHMIGGIQMPFASLAVLLVFILVVNLSLRCLRGVPFLRPFTTLELVAFYSMMLFGALLSTPGCDNVFLTTGATLFYFGSAENKWAGLFYSHVPAWFAPGWDGVRFQMKVIAPLYLGNISWADIPWHAWAVMLTAWSVFLGFIYGLLFFTALLFRKQWVEYESLTFPLVEVPLQMVKTSTPNGAAPSVEFWANRTMWLGFGLACFIHLFKGMNSVFPDWPVFPVNAFNSVALIFTERPWDIIPTLKAEVFLGGIGVAYLLTRELSFSFWFFFMFFMLQTVVSGMMGFPAVSFKLSNPDQVNFILSQTTGGWLMMALLLIWAAREHLGRMVVAAWKSQVEEEDEPFSPRFMVLGFAFCFAGLLLWSWYAGINLLIALVFFGVFTLTSLVLARVVSEGGFMFPNAPFSLLDTMVNSTIGYQAIGAASLTKLSFIQPVIATDMRTNILPALLGVMKLGHEVGIERTQLRRLLLCCLMAIVTTVGITIVVSIALLYSKGGLQLYGGFASGSASSSFRVAAAAMRTEQPVNPFNYGWMALGAMVVWGIIIARGRFLWFPLHPLGYLMAAGGPIRRLWFSFFVGWLIKTLVMKYIGSDGYLRLRPFMIGLILGNAVAMIFWMIIGLCTGSQTAYWPA